MCVSVLAYFSSWFSGFWLILFYYSFYTCLLHICLLKEKEEHKSFCLSVDSSDTRIEKWFLDWDDGFSTPSSEKNIDCDYVDD